MSARLISRYADDPRVLTVIVTALVAVVLWMATWHSMSGMAGMSMDGMEMGGGMSMAVFTRMCPIALLGIAVRHMSLFS